jgi:hypothetical protein
MSYRICLLSGAEIGDAAIQKIEDIVVKYFGLFESVTASCGDEDMTFQSLRQAFTEMSKRRETCLYFWREGSIRVVRESPSELSRAIWLSHSLQIDVASKRNVSEMFEALIYAVDPFFGQIRTDRKTIETIAYGLPSSLGLQCYLSTEIERQIPPLSNIVEGVKRLGIGAIFQVTTRIREGIGSEFFEVAENLEKNEVVYGFFAVFKALAEQVIRNRSRRAVFRIERSGCNR